MIRLLCFSSFFVWAFWMQSLVFAYDTFDFDLKKAQINNKSYQKYIVPQLRFMVSDFLHIIRKISPEQKQFIDLYTEYQNFFRPLSEALNDLKANPPTTQTVDKISGIKTDLLLLENKLINHRIELLNKRNLFQSPLQLDINMAELMANLKNLNHYILLLINPLVLDVPEVGQIKYSQIIQDITRLAHLVQLDIEFIAFEMLPEGQREAFTQVWNHFFKTIIQILSIEDSKQAADGLFKSLGELNIGWHTFSMQVIKQEISMPDKTDKVVALMLNRWNSILKMIL